jgi:hypothetical protein
MTKSRHWAFTAEFKAQVVLEVIGGVKSFTEADTLPLCSITRCAGFLDVMIS